MPRGRTLDLTLPKGKKPAQKDVRSKIREFWKREWENERNRAVNLNLLKALGMFAGAVVAFRTIGEAVFM
ncbi:hypothetical protein BSKO_06643 [Bryopsis sp. KO-2023]|nr:hypothetical protein BSKO_06643 [Bryopsis sp. KO-2023]